MEIVQWIVVVVCLVSSIVTSYTHGNRQANDLMIKQGGIINSWRIWTNFSTTLDFVLFWIIPMTFALVAFNYLGFLYLLFVWLIVAKTSHIFLVGQLRKRLTYEEGYYKKELKKWKHSRKEKFDLSVVDLEITEHNVNELKWLISHPKMTQHLALSAHDDKANLAILAAFEVQVGALDALDRKSREMELNNKHLSKKTMYYFEGTISNHIGSHYKKYGIFAKKRLLRKLKKQWKSGSMHLGTPGEVRNQLGEAKATQLFVKIVEKIIYTPGLLEKSVMDYREHKDNLQNETRAED
jgi:hypothetical protein